MGIPDYGCKVDYKKHHFWVPLGIVGLTWDCMFRVVRCSQCNLCAYEKLEFIKDEDKGEVKK